MAEFVSVDKNKYKIVGVLTEEDITKINAFKNRTTLNTRQYRWFINRFNC